MVSNQILQNTIDGLKAITRIDLCLIDDDGKVVATTFPDTDECEIGRASCRERVSLAV